MELAWKYFSSFIFDKLLSGNLNLDCLPIKIVSTQWVPSVAIPDTLEITFDALIDALRTGCIIDLSNYDTSEGDSPLVGGVYVSRRYEEVVECMIDY